MFPFAPLPLILEATFIPFRNVIISDGLVLPYNILIGSNMKKQFKDIYMTAKKNGTLIKSLQQNGSIKLHEGAETLIQKWKKFDKLTDKCYSNMIGAELDGSCWLKAFELLKEIVQEERDKNPSFAPELELLDEATDYRYDIQGWLDDCLDEIDMREEYETLLKMCDDLLHLFNLPEDTRADLKFRKSSALNSIGRYKEAAKYCEKWIEQEPENIVAATAGIYTYINTKDFTAAEKLVDRFIFDKSLCGDDNDIMFTAASKLYEAMGKIKEKKQIDRALKDYDKYLQDYYCENPYYEYEDMEFGEDYLPFN